MEHVLVNKVGKAARKKMGGREYLVAPVSMIVHGVLNGSDGPGYYPLDELAKDPSIWNHIPVVLRHPTLNGQPVSARHPDVLDQRGVGVVLASRFDNENLSGEVWIDVENANRVDPRIVRKMEAGELIEVSTGLKADRDATAGTHNGREYKWVARNFKPDHLAILLDEKGACSVHDGCGINNEQSIWQRLVALVSGAEQKTVIANQEKDMEKKKELVEFLTANCDCWKGDAATLNTFSEEKLTKLKAAFDATKQLGEQIATLTANAKQPPPVAQPVAVNTAELAKAMALEIKTQVANAVAEATERGPLMARLLANVKAEDKAAKETLLNGKTVAELKDMVSFLPQTRELFPAGGTYLMGGADSVPVANSAEDEADVLAMLPPVTNYAALNGKSA